MENVLRSTRVTLEMIKWEHSIFALPFALTGAVLAAGGWPRLAVLGWILVCMVSARSAAMAFNRLVDAKLDAGNPRTAMRAIPAGQLSEGFVAAFTTVAVGVFLFAATMLNRLTLELAPVALAVVLGYSYMKRVTRWSHLVLGLALGIAPSAAWIAVRGSYDVRALLLTAIVIFWVGGFDVLYACQDFEYDRRVGLFSVPAAFGLEGAFWIARGMHLGVVVLIFVLVHVFALGPIALAGMCLVTALLAYEHAIVKPGDLSRMNAAFFTLNGMISVVFFVAVAGDVLKRG
jgi:4-hydroxybenzoate polyprenyltransferase